MLLGVDFGFPWRIDRCFICAKNWSGRTELLYNRAGWLRFQWLTSVTRKHALPSDAIFAGTQVVTILIASLCILGTIHLLIIDYFVAWKFPRINVCVHFYVSPQQMIILWALSEPYAFDTFWNSLTSWTSAGAPAINCIVFTHIQLYAKTY